MKRATRALELLIIFAVIALGAWAFIIEPNQLVVHSESIALPGWPAKLNGLKVAALGDIHAGSLFINDAKLREIVELTNNQHPDLIVLLGDFMVQNGVFKSEVAPEKIVAGLKDLKAPLGVYAVLGNHDWWFNGNRVKSALESVGIKVIDNQITQLTRDHESFWLVGLADAWTAEQKIKGTFAKVPAGGRVIAVTHNPDVFLQMPANCLLLIAAHTHGGQVNTPYFGRLVVPSNYGQRFAAGKIEENGKQLFVTTGIGTSIFPVRFRVPPEIAVLSLNSKGVLR
jgi:predicted MPP superfamily phosphohydrolase